jgi:hypothetical protein
MRTAILILIAPLLLSGCLAGAAIGAAGAVVGTTAKVAVGTVGAVVETGVDIVTPDGDDEDEKKAKKKND